MQRVEARLLATGAALLLFALAAAPVQANARSQQLYAKALLAFQAQKWEQAQLLLDEAAAADPDDAVVAYYRGLTNARLGFRDRAIADIEHALALRPDLQGAALDLGILYFEAGQYQPAGEWLERASRQPATHFSAALFLGLTKLRTGDPEAAQPLFAEAAKDPSLRQAALYYQGVASIRAGNRDEGRALLGQVQAGPPDSETTQIAQQYLAAAPGTAVAGEDKWWEVYANGGFGYDSNVTLTPDNVTIGQRLAPGAPPFTLVGCYSLPNCPGLDRTGETDGFFAVGLGGKLRLLDTDLVDAWAGYDLYQSVHFQTSSFDLQNHEVHLDVATSLQGPLQFGVSGFYDFYLLDYATFYQQGRFVPWTTLFEGDIAATQVYYQLIGQDYLGSTTPGLGYSTRDPFNPFRDAWNNAFGIRQFFLLGAEDRFLSLGYQWDDNDPTSRDGTDFAYTDNIFDVRLDFGFLDRMRGTAGYAVDLQNYEHKNSRTDFTKRRHDFSNQIVLRFVFDVTDYLSADLAYYGVINESNIPDFQYDRNIIQASVRVQL